uniref:Col_cuticle_N domain-containing protein n=1 Tax=Panagrellus redivivus TaxID=6233 RepID=A0A7E4UYG9_PANRE
MNCKKQEKLLSPDAMFTYIIIATTIAFGCALLVLAIMAICTQIHRFLTYLCDSDDNETVSTVEVVTPAQQAALHILEQLTVQMIESATLPSYNSACLRCTPVRVADPPPPYPPIPIPPPSYLTTIGQPSTHNMTLTQEPPKYTPNYDCNI